MKGRYVSGTSTLVISSAPTDIALSNSSVVENAPIGTLVGALSTTDADSWDTFTYTIVSGSGFSIDGNLLRTSQSFNYESQSSATVRIRSTDSSGFYTEKDFTIQITNANDAPTDISLSSAAAVRGAAIGTLVGTLTTTDEDVGDTFSYSLVYGFGENYLFSISGNQVLTAAVFDGSTPSSCLIRIISTDSGGKTVQKNFTITVT